MGIPLRRVASCRRRGHLCMPRYPCKPRFRCSSGSCCGPCGSCSSGCCPCWSCCFGLFPELCCGPWCESCLDPAWFSWLAPNIGKACGCARPIGC